MRIKLGGMAVEELSSAPDRPLPEPARIAISNKLSKLAYRS